MKKDEKYFGIKLNNDIPKLDKVNEYSKEVELKFIGKAYLIERKDDKIEKTKIENYYKLDKEDNYEIEFTNNKNETYTIKVRIKKSYLFLIILFLVACLLGIILSSSINNQDSVFNRFYDFVNISILELDIENKKENPIIEYAFDVTFKNITSEDIELQDTIHNEMSAESIAKNKIAPGISGSFAILISTEKSMVDMKYSVSFEDITDEKPRNLLFKVRGHNEEFSSLQELEKYLIGISKKHTQSTIIIDWRWVYETDELQDLIDTKDGKSLENYKFRINVQGEEVL